METAKKSISNTMNTVCTAHKEHTMTQQVLTILGSTGSIGESTLDVVSRHPEKFRVFALAGHRQVDKLAAQCKQFRPEYAVVGDADHAAELERNSNKKASIRRFYMALKP